MSTDNTIRRRTFLAVTLAAAGSAATACGFGDDGNGNGSDDANGEARDNGDEQTPQRGGTLHQSMLPVAHIDPAVAGGASFAHIMMNGLWERLVNIDVDDITQVEPGVAESWDISADLLTYTFHLRSDATWSNGDPVTAQDFEWNWQRILTPGIAGEANPSYNNNRVGVVGAGAYQSGETEDFDDVGVKALDESTFEITLERPNPDLLIVLGYAHWALPLHPATIEELAEEWLDPQNWVSNGAYVLDEFRVNQGAALLPNEEYWNKENYHLDRWEITFNDAGTVADLLSYQNDDIDITGRIEDDLEAVTTSDVASELMTSPTNQYRHLVTLNSRHPALHDVRVRQALSKAIDREALAEVATPAIPGTSLVPEGVEGYQQIPVEEHNVDAALALLDEAGFPNGEGIPTITILDFQSSPWVEAIAQMWRENLNIDVTLDIVEIGVYNERRAQLHDENYTGFAVRNNSVNPPTLVSTAFAPPTSPLAVLEGMNLSPVEVAEELVDAIAAGASPAELGEILDGRRHPEMEEALALMREALNEEDPDAQQAKLVQAAIAEEQARASIPVLWGGYNLLVKPQVQNLRLWNFQSVFTTKGVYIEE